MPGVIATATGSDWNAGGSIMTFFAPVGLFIGVAAILYLMFSRPHRRIPSRPLAAARAASPDPGAARAAAVAGGLPTAAGGGGTESRLEPAGAAAGSEADDVAGGSRSDDAGQACREGLATDGTEAGE